jgi:hypothetical protein
MEGEFGPDLPGAQESSKVLSPQALQEIVQVEAQIAASV